MRDWIVDLVCFVTATGVSLLLVNDASATQPSWVTLADGVGGGVCCVLLWWRRRWPVAIGMLVATTPFSSPLVAGIIMIVTVAVHRRARPALLVSLAGVVSTPVWAFVRWPAATSSWTDVAGVVALLASLNALGMAERARRRSIASVQDRALRAEWEQQRSVDEARHGERARIAHEMHDVLSDRLSLLSVNAEALNGRREADPAQVTAAAGTIRADAHQALKQLREVIGVLRQAPAEHATVQDASRCSPVPPTAPSTTT